MNNKLKHIAFIMDGNGRWAKKRKLNRIEGHKQGLKALKKVIESCEKHNIEYVTFYAFSTENWKRPKDEIDNLMQLPEQFYNELKDKQKIKDESEKIEYKISFIGRRSKISKKHLEFIVKCEEETKNNKGMNIVIALDYGSKEEIVSAVNKIDNKLSLEITEEDIEKNLYTSEFPPVDLLVRTSNERRISNFLLWQIAYSELYFEKKNWPEMNNKIIKKIINDYNKRNRRFGGLED